MTRNAGLAQYSCEHFNAARSQYEACLREPLGTTTTTPTGLPETGAGFFGLSTSGQAFAAVVLLLCGLSLLVLLRPWFAIWWEDHVTGPRA